MSVAQANETRDEYRSEYELTLERWLRRRFTYLCGAFVALEMIITAILVGNLMQGRDVSLATMLVPPTALAVAAYFLWRVRHQISTRGDVLRAANHLLLLLGGLTLLHDGASSLAGVERTYNTLGQLMFLHVSASLFLAWTPRESVRPMVPLLVVWAILELLVDATRTPADALVLIAISPLILLPGIGIASLRTRRLNRRFRSEMFRRGFLGLRREIAQASSIHESLFPEPLTSDVFTFDFVYRPMRFLGGDFIHRSLTPSGRLRIILLDVTGHGLAAAMTVTRLDGEIERILAEQPDIEPRDLLKDLNHYSYLTLAPHSIFATGLVAEVEPSTGVLRFASAGHPAAFVRTLNGEVSSLPSTGIMLGAEDTAGYVCTQTTLTLLPQSVLILYTDGVIESRGPDGEQLGLERFEALLRRQPPPNHWPTYLDGIITNHSGTHPEDDVLIASLCYLGPPRP